MNEPKKQHYVPRMLLKNFVDESNGMLYFYSKKNPAGGVQQASPEKLFRQQHLYTRRGEKGSKDFSVENGLADLETISTPVINRIMQLTRGCKPSAGIAHRVLWNEVTCDDRLVLCSFIASQQTRVPDFQDSVVGDTEFERIAHRTMEDLRAKGHVLTPSERDRLLSPPELKRMRKNLMAGLAVPNETFVKMLVRKQIHVIRITKNNKSLVVGSRPVVRPGKMHLEEPEAQVWLAISHDVVVALCSQDKWTIGSDDIRKLNEAVFRQSTLIAGRSHKLIASLSGCRHRRPG